MGADPIVRVWYLELRAAPAAALAPPGTGHLAAEPLTRPDYLELYRRVGAQVRWDQRLQMPGSELDELLAGDHLHVHVLRTAAGERIGLCEFDRCRFPDVELKNFGLVPEAQGRGLGKWLLAEALRAEWQSGATRIWLHTDSWDHPAAMHLYSQAGFQLFAERNEPAGPL